MLEDNLEELPGILKMLEDVPVILKKFLKILRESWRVFKDFAGILKKFLKRSRESWRVFKDFAGFLKKPVQLFEPSLGASYFDQKTLGRSKTQRILMLCL